MLKYANLLDSLLSTAKEGSFLTGVEYTWDKESSKLKIDRKTFTKNCLFCSVLCALYIYHLSLNYRTLKTTTRNNGIEATLGITTAITLGWIVHYTYLMTVNSAEYESFVSAAYAIETSNEKQIKRALKNPSIQRVVAITKLVVALGRHVSIKASHILFGLLGALFPNLPTNILSFYPGKGILDLVELTARGHDWMYICLKFAIVGGLNGLVFGVMAKITIVCIVQILVGAVVFPTYLSIITTGYNF